MQVNAGQYQRANLKRFEQALQRRISKRTEESLAHTRFTRHWRQCRGCLSTGAAFDAAAIIGRHPVWHAIETSSAHQCLHMHDGDTASANRLEKIRDGRDK